ncbi:MAG TPA: acetylxylan esterase [Chitinophagaceae bacterium]
MKARIIIPVLLTMTVSLQAQQPVDVYRKPLKDVLKEVEKEYHVGLIYEDKNVKDLDVNYASWRFVSDVNTTLDNILKPLDLVYKQTAKDSFEITKYEYFRRSEEEGAKHLQELFSLYTSVDAFTERKKNLREAIFSTLGIRRFAKKTPLNPIVRSRREMNGYIVENVAFESVPGYFVTGTLYRPAKSKGPLPVILNPHGHFYNKIDQSIPDERGRYRPDMQYRCAALAKMGAIVFNYDMYAWGESVLQAGNKSYHRTGFALAMQTWNSMRALDFLLSLKDADKTRVGITGASGGGTQTFLLAALDDRVTASVPVVMVSSSFYGGCPCESGLAIHQGCDGHKTNNAEIAALTAPRPQLVISDGNDWTRSVPGTDYPYLKKVYALFGKEDNVSNVHLPNDQHDYGFSKREPMYRFFAKQFGMNLQAITDKNGKIDESFVTIEKSEALLVFGKDFPLPAYALRSHDAIVKAFEKAQEDHPE